MWKAMFMKMIRWKWVSYFSYSHSELVIMFSSPQFAQIICFLLCCLQMNRLHWSHFIDADEFFCRTHMKQLPHFFGGLPAMPSPSSPTGSGRYFSRNLETSLGSEGIWDLETRCSFIRLNDRFFKKSILRCGSSDGVLMVHITQELMPAMFIRI